MTSVASSSSSSNNLHCSTPQTGANYVPPSPPSIHSNRSAMSSSSSLSQYSLEHGDDENETVTGNRMSGETVSNRVLGKQKSQSQEDLRLLAVSTHITELSYAISDIQTRIFEIQELRHKSQSQSVARDPSSPTSNINNVTSIIDQSLMSLDERLEAVQKGINSVNENMVPYLPVSATPTTATQSSMAVTPTAANINRAPSSSVPPKVNEGSSALVRKHTALVSEWESVQDESDVLREELKEDKWLTVFRTVTDQADGMMSSLEKAVNRCQDFIFQVHQQKRSGINGGEDLFGSTSASRSGGPITLETHNSLLESYEAKKKHYMPATSKVLSIIDRGVRDRVTKNGETLRRHSESAQRWKNLRDRIARTDTELENVRKILLFLDAGESENGSSSASGHHNSAISRGGYLATPPSGSRPPASGGSEKGSEKGGGTLSRSISPFRKFARRITGSTSGGYSKPNISKPVLVTPLAVNKKMKAPASEPPPVSASSSGSNFNTFSHTLRKQRTSLFAGAMGCGPDPITPDRPGHKYSHSATPESSPRSLQDDLAGENTKSYAGYTTSTLGKARSSLATGTLPPNLAGRPTWNSSTKVNGTSDAKRTPGGTTRGTLSRGSSRPPSASGMYNFFSSAGDTIPPVPSITTGTPYRRSLSRTSMASSRPWSPLSSTTHSSSQNFGKLPPVSLSNSVSASSSRFISSRPPSRPPSRSQTPSRLAGLGVSLTPRQRPRTPSNIPAPARSPGRSASVGTKADMFLPSGSDWSPSRSRPFSPAMSASGAGDIHHPRPPSRSMIPVPTVHVSAISPGGRSRPSSSMSHLGHGYAGRAGSESPTMRTVSGTDGVSPFRTNARRAQTPDMMMMRSVSAATGGANAGGTGTLSRPTVNTQRLPPSSFRDGSSGSAVSSNGGSVYATPNSRPSSRSGLYDGGNMNTSMATLMGPLHEYAVGNGKDPLDVEVGRVANAIPHGLTIERVDPPLKKAPKDGEEVKAQYALSNALGRKVVTCRLTTMTRATRVKTGGEAGHVEKETVATVTTKKVMCRVGGGWQDLSLYILNRQAGL